jgi:opacity protein-like surface antigen
LKRTAIGFALVFAATSAAAQQKPQQQYWYLGASAGQTIIDLHDDAVPIAGNPPSTLNKGGSSTGFRLFLGYRLARHFALEGSYLKSGGMQATRTANAGGTMSAALRVTGWSVEGLGIVPFANGVSVFGKLGGVRATTEATYSANGVAAPADANPRYMKNSFKYGIGAFYDLSEHFSLRADYEIVKNVGNSATGQADVKFLSAGVLYRF